MAIKFNIEGPEGKRKRELEDQERELRSRILRAQEAKLTQDQPEYRANMAANIAEKTAEIEEKLNLNAMQKAGISERLGNISSASVPLSESTAGPVMPQQAAMQASQGLIQEEDMFRAQQTRMRAQLEAYRKEQEGLVGTVNLGEAYGTAPAGSEDSVLRRRVQKFATISKEARDFVAGSTSAEEAQDRQAAVNAYKPLFDAETRRQAQNALKLPGLDGQAKDEDAARNMRKRVPDFVSTIVAIDRLLELGDLAQKSLLVGSVGPSQMQLARYRAEAEQIRIPLVAALRVPLLGGGQMTEQEREFIQSAIARPTDFFNFASTDKLKTLKRVVGSEFTSASRNYGYSVKSLQQVLDANSVPADIDTFGAPNQTKLPSATQAPSKPKPAATYNPATGLLR
jgi:hypothetical protein